MHTKKTADLFRIIVLSAVLSATLGYALADWTPPTSNPPYGNPPPPVNVGPVSQVREGALFINNWLTAAKAQTASTVAGDDGHVLVTKDYLDAKIAGVGGDNMGNRDALGGVIINLANPVNAQDAATKNYVDTKLGTSPTYINMYQCPEAWSLGGGAWGFYGCTGQITSQSVCGEVEYPHNAQANCTYVGKMALYP